MAVTVNMVASKTVGSEIEKKLQVELILSRIERYGLETILPTSSVMETRSFWYISKSRLAYSGFHFG